jgi:flagellar biosynthesis/type III secretory pathway M-ring protein FliF/YscJ
MAYTKIYETQVIPPGKVISKTIIAYVPDTFQDRIADYQSAVATALRLKPEEFKVFAHPFPKPPSIPEPSLQERLMEGAIEHMGEISLGFFAFLALFFVARSLKRFIPEAPADLAIGAEALQAQLEELAKKRSPSPLDERGQELRTKIQGFIDDNPQGVALLLRNWGKEEG